MAQIKQVDEPTTQIESYEASREFVAEGLQNAQSLFHQAETQLRELFEAAENDGDKQKMEMVNQTYDAVQRMAALMGQQGTLLSGAHRVIDTLRMQRDDVLDELNEILAEID